MLQSRLEFYLAQLRLQKKEKLAPALPPTLALDNNGITKSLQSRIELSKNKAFRLMLYNLIK